jgi:adenylate cyclase
MTAATACRTCGTEPREGARFCDGCGAPVTAHDIHAEYKQVTVLFAELVTRETCASVGRAESALAGWQNGAACTCQACGAPKKAASP